MKRSDLAIRAAFACAFLLALPVSGSDSGAELELANLRSQATSELADLRAELGRFTSDLQLRAAEDPDYRSLLHRAETLVARLHGLGGRLHDLLGEPAPPLRELRRLADEVERSWAAYHRIRLAVEAGSRGHRVAALGTGSISGRLIDALTGDGVVGQRVELDDDDFSNFPAVYSDASGAFYFGGLADGTYFVHVNGSLDYIAELYDDIPCDGFCYPFLGTPIEVTAGAAVAGIDLVLDRAGKVFGRVTGADSGLGLRSATVRIYDGCDNVAWTSTDETGRYELGGLSTSSTYRMAAFPRVHYVPQLYDGLPWPGGCDLSAGTPVPVTVNAITTDIDFSLERGSVIEGTVTDAISGAPVESTRITVYDDVGITTGWDVYTDAQGRYATTVGLEAGDYYVRASPPYYYLGELYDDVPCHGPLCDPTTGTPLAVPATATVSGIDFSLDQGARIEGRVTAADTGLPLTSVPVRTFDQAGQHVETDYSFGFGYYQIYDIEPGTYFVTAGGHDAYLAELYEELPCPSSSCAPTTGTPVVASLNSVTSGIDFTLPRGGAISGTVADGPSGASISGATVEVYLEGWGWAGSGETDSLGRFAAEGLETGQHFAEATPGAPPHLPELYQEIAFPGYDDWQDGTPIGVVEGAITTGVDFTLDRGGTVRGTVHDETTAAGLDDVTVRLYGENGYLRGLTRTDGLGTYEFIGLQPGDVFLRTDVGYSPWFDELYSNLACSAGCDPTTGTPVPVAVNATVSGIDFSLTRGGLLIGRVIDALTRAPVRSTAVTVEGPGGFSETSYTSSSGSLATRGLQAGDYRVKATKSGYHGQRFENLSCAGDCDMLQATPIPITLGMDETLDFELFPRGLDPDLHISHEMVCTGDFVSCGDIALGPSLELCGPTTFVAGESVLLLDDVTVADLVAISTDESLSCP